jgi:ABC-type transport system involved in multi-copper enzyme maturation permease subunit
MFDSILQPAIAYARKDFLEAIGDRRLIAVSVILGAILIGTSAAVTTLMVGTPTPGSGASNIPNPFDVWLNGTSGVLTGIAFGITPVVLPFLPMLAASRGLERDRARGIYQLSLAKPIPPWGPALGKFVGLYAALAIPTAAISAGVVLATYVVAGSFPSGGLLGVFIGANVILVGLYLLLTLWVGAFLPKEFVGSVSLLIWVGFNALEQTGFFITARLMTILGADQAATFQSGWTDLATFTGLYHGLLAPAVPGELRFVVGSFDVAQMVPWAILVWFVSIYFVYAILLWRMPSR